MCGPETVCYYKVLGVQPVATESEIKMAYRSVIRSCHPDKLAHTSKARSAAGEFHTKQLNNAYDCLGDSEARAKFDIKCAASTEVSISSYNRYAPSTSHHAAQKRSQERTNETTGQAKRPRGERDAPPPESKSKPSPVPNSSRCSNLYMYDANGWKFAVTISPKYTIWAPTSVITTSKMHLVAVSMTFVIELNASFSPPFHSTAEPDVSLTVTITPIGRDVSAVNSLVQYSIRSPFGLGMPHRRDLALTLTSHRNAGPLLLPTSLAFNITLTVEVPSYARYTATHLVFTRDEPSIALQDFQLCERAPVFPKNSAEHTIEHLRELQAYNEVSEKVAVLWLDLKKAGAKCREVQGQDRIWWRMAAVGHQVVERSMWTWEG